MSSPLHQLSSRRFNAYPGQSSFENFSDFEPFISRRPFSAIAIPKPPRPSSSNASNLLPRRARTAPPRLARGSNQVQKTAVQSKSNSNVESKQEDGENSAFSHYLKKRHHGSLGSLFEADTDTLETEASCNGKDAETMVSVTENIVEAPTKRKQSAKMSVKPSHTPPVTPQRTGPIIERLTDSSRTSRQEVISDPRLVYDRESEQNTVLDDESVQKGWLKRRNCYGFPYYAHEKTGEETWEKPIVLPKGWEERDDPNGFPYYLDSRTGFITWEKPEVLPFGWERQTSNDGRLYYLHYHSNLSTWDKPDPSTLQMLQTSN
ncbi:uncharacterized protein LOC100373001 [Saccoglossus kowalevskii]|uniref:NEDD4-like E3 ubiquitin-protein ligase WWP1-like n=1 Tax=Saccoglossus kowalevskii TaxID=10224 RepID=A0ABM0GZV7_SACKO|nr:PREDICTED: NEDD4-like E3 ubiquitin-protein ligase WWP1-like [Saccoglossus kowalevskii]